MLTVKGIIVKGSIVEAEMLILGFRLLACALNVLLRNI